MGGMLPSVPLEHYWLYTCLNPSFSSPEVLLPCAPVLKGLFLLLVGELLEKNLPVTHRLILGVYLAQLKCLLKEHVKETALLPQLPFFPVDLKWVLGHPKTGVTECWDRGSHSATSTSNALCCEERHQGVKSDLLKILWLERCGPLVIAGSCFALPGVKWPYVVWLRNRVIKTKVRVT